MAGMRRSTGVVVAVVVAATSLGLAGWREPARAAPPDPTAAGPFKFAKTDYDAGEFMVRYGQRTTYPEQLRGSIVYPTTGGRRPLIVLLHGNHQNCRVVFYETISPLCKETPATGFVENHTGYEYFAENLASHGYVVVSASANGTNGSTFTQEATGTEGRVQVLERTLELVEKWNAKAQPPVDDVLVGRVDMSRIGLMGHSRGGEAVTRFITHNRALGGRWKLRAVVALAATDFGKHRPSGVPFAALLPTCDGDVFDLQGSHAFERAEGDAPRVQWVVRGTNHNFFNTVWTYDDGGSNKHSPCNRTVPTRLTADSQRHVGLFLMGAFLRRHVGNEVALEAAAAGGSLPKAECVGRCYDDVVRTTYLPLEQVLLDLPDTQSGPVSITRCDASITKCPSAAHRSWTQQLFLRWTQSAALTLHRTPVDLRGRSVVLRVAVDRDHKENQGAAAVALRVVDAKGRVATVDLRGPALRPMNEWIYGEMSSTGAEYYLGSVIPPTTGPAHVVLSDVRVPASAFARVDLRRIESIDLVLGPRGAMYLAAASVQ